MAKIFHYLYIQKMSLLNTFPPYKARLSNVGRLSAAAIALGHTNDSGNDGTLRWQTMVIKDLDIYPDLQLQNLSGLVMNGFNAMNPSNLKEYFSRPMAKAPYISTT
jgi:hypothetical protein